jgi:hypothetical protein
MTLSQSAVSDLLDAFRAGDGVDLIRESVRLVLQELIEVEATEVMAPLRMSAVRAVSLSATAAGHACWQPRPVISSSPFPSSARARSSRASWNRAGGSTRPSMRS